MNFLRVVFAGLMLCLASISLAEVTAEVELSVEAYATAKANDSTAWGDRLHANVRLHGIAPSEKFAYEFRWTAPEGVPFKDSVYPDPDSGKKLYAGDDTDEPVCESNPTQCQCYCEDTKERGCWRTRSFRTVSATWSGKSFRATGIWKVEVVRVDSGEVLGSASYELK